MIKKDQFGEFKLHHIIPPLKIGSRSKVVLEFLEDNSPKDFSLKELMDSCNIGLSYAQSN